MSKNPKIHLYLRGKKYWYVFLYQKKRHRGSCETDNEKEALRHAEHALSAVIREESTETIEAQAGTLPPSQVFEHYREKLRIMGRSKGTLDNYKRYQDKYVEFFRDKPLSHLSRFAVESWRDWLLQLPVKCHNWNKQKGTYSKKLVAEHLCWLAVICNYYGLENPVNRVEIPRRSQAERVEELEFYNADEMKRLLKKTEELYDLEFKSIKPLYTDPSGIPMYDEKQMIFGEWKEFNLWFRLMAWTGIRLGEMRNIRFKDVDDNRKMITVYSSKTKKRRGLGLLQEAYGTLDGSWNVLDVLREIAIQHYIRTFPKNSKKTSIKSLIQDKPIYTRYANWFYKTLKRACEAAGVPFKGVHAIRHSFASQWLGKYDIAALAKFLGHRNIQMTYDTYGHLLNQRAPKMWTEDDNQHG